MSEELNMALALQTYNTMCEAIERRNWHYTKTEEKLLVHFGVNGDDIPMQLILRVDAERQVVRLMSPLPFKMSESKRIEGAIAACAASYGLVDGYFEYDLSDGMIVYKISTSYRDSVLGEGVVQYLIDCASAVVDRYNDMFLALEKNLISLEDFIKKS